MSQALMVVCEDDYDVMAAILFAGAIVIFPVAAITGLMIWCSLQV